MTAPARATPPSTPTRTRTRTTTGTEQPTATPTRLAPVPERTGAGARARSAAAERAYARRAQRTRSTEVGPKPERGSSSAARASFVMLVIGLLVSGVVTTLWLSTQATADSYKLAQAQQNTGALSEQVQSMQRQVDQANSPEALAARARQLGMVPAGDPAHLVVGPDGSVTVVGTPSAATAPPPPPPPPPPPASPPPPPAKPTTPTNTPTTAATATPGATATAGRPPATSPSTGRPPAGG